MAPTDTGVAACPPPLKAPSTCDISRKAHRTGPDAAAVGVPITPPAQTRQQGSREPIVRR